MSVRCRSLGKADRKGQKRVHYLGDDTEGEGIKGTGKEVEEKRGNNDLKAWGGGMFFLTKYIPLYF